MQNIEQMSNLEKVQAMEQLWESLTAGQNIPASPSWHQDELSARASRIREGKTTYKSLDQLKERGVSK